MMALAMLPPPMKAMGWLDGSSVVLVMAAVYRRGRLVTHEMSAAAESVRIGIGKTV